MFKRLIRNAAFCFCCISSISYFMNRPSGARQEEVNLSNPNLPSLTIANPNAVHFVAAEKWASLARLFKMCVSGLAGFWLRLAWLCLVWCISATISAPVKWENLKLQTYSETVTRNQNSTIISAWVFAGDVKWLGLLIKKGWYGT